MEIMTYMNLKNYFDSYIRDGEGWILAQYTGLLSEMGHEIELYDDDVDTYDRMYDHLFGLIILDKEVQKFFIKSEILSLENSDNDLVWLNFFNSLK